MRLAVGAHPLLPTAEPAEGVRGRTRPECNAGALAPARSKLALIGADTMMA